MVSYWRDRRIGPQLIDHPDAEGKKVLHLRRPDENDGDGAVWNFPNGRKGKLKLRIMLNEGFKGGSIALTDRFAGNSPQGTGLSVTNVTLFGKSGYTSKTH